MRQGVSIRKILLACFLLLQVFVPVFGQDQQKKVLFVGNSYTYFWNLPKTVQEMARSQGDSWIVRQSTAGGSSWEDHWEGAKNLKTRSIINETAWDLIILQNHSLSALENPQSFRAYGDSLILLAKSTGADILLYQTWARKTNPLMMEAIKNEYMLLADRHQIEVVQVGEIWEMVRQYRPELELYDSDGSHPSTTGTYLTACIFYSALTGSKSSNIPKRIVATDQNQQPLYLAILSQENADFLQAVVDRFYSYQKGDE